MEKLWEECKDCYCSIHCNNRIIALVYDICNIVSNTMQRLCLKYSILVTISKLYFCNKRIFPLSFCVFNINIPLAYVSKRG